MSQHLFSIFFVCLKFTSQLQVVHLSALHCFQLATRRTPPQKMPVCRFLPVQAWLQLDHGMVVWVPASLPACRLFLLTCPDRRQRWCCSRALWMLMVLENILLAWQVLAVTPSCASAPAAGLRCWSSFASQAPRMPGRGSVWKNTGRIL